MSRFTVDAPDVLLDMLLNSKDDILRDDAAEYLAIIPNHEGAERALLQAIESPQLDYSLQITCADSLSQIWIRTGQANRSSLDKLKGVPKELVAGFLHQAGIDL
jgi:hypothetical protein